MEPIKMWKFRRDFTRHSNRENVRAQQFNELPLIARAWINECDIHISKYTTRHANRVIPTFMKDEYV